MVEKIKSGIKFDTEIALKDVKTELEVMDTKEISDRFDQILEARDELFDKRVKRGLNAHEKFLKTLK